MQNELKIAGIQSDLIWENPLENRKQFSKMIENLEEDVDLIVLPEMFTTGFTMHPKNVSEKMNGDSISWMKKIAKERNVAITGSLVIEVDEKFYNRLVFVHPSQKIDIYDKRHLFTLAGEHKQYSAGNKQVIVNYKGWKICPFICYDLRFPVFSRNTTDYDLLIFMANWPSQRVNAWDVLLKARAIENMSFTIGVNRVGVDANDYNYSGSSTIVDFLGNNMAILSQNEKGIVTAVLNKKSQDETRKKLCFLNDKDEFKIL